MPGSSSWMPYASQGVKGFDDDDNDDIGHTKQTYCQFVKFHDYF